MNDAAGVPAAAAHAVPAAPPVLFDRLLTASGHAFGHATLNAPATLNSLSLPMIELLTPQLAAWAADDEIAGVVLDATGDKAFCAGGDILQLHRAKQALGGAAGVVPPQAAAFFEHEYRLDYRIHTYAKPLLVWGHGVVMGGGLGLMAGASHRVATPRARLAMPEVTIGLFPDVGGSWFLQRMPGRIGTFLALTGANLNAADALFARLADFVLPHDSHDAALAAIAAQRWQGARDADAAQLSHLLQRLATAGLPASPLRTHYDRIDALIDHDALHDIAPRLAALRGDADGWLARAGESFAAGSPTSIVLSLELLRRAHHMSLAEVFRLEYQAAIGCCAHADFAEGIRALLVDKDRNPRWTPDTMAQVTPMWIEDHLRPRFGGPHPLADLQ